MSEYQHGYDNGYDDSYNLANGRCADALHELNKKIKHIESQLPRWISVEDELPKPGQEVVVICKNYIAQCCCYVETGVFYSIKTGSEFVGVPLFWTPLPEPPDA
jgi:hypothetical protein